jgi:acyl carrier protein
MEGEPVKASDSAMFEAVVDVVATRFNIDPSMITPGATFDDLELDSLSQLELVTTLEERLGVEITDDELADMAGLAEILTALEGKSAPA